MVRVRLLAACVLAACAGDGDKPPPRPEREPPRRVIEPPRGDLRALPPHEITAAGIGPYRLAMPMAEILSTLPSGPRLALIQIPGVVDHSAVHDDGLIIGGERGGDASFVAVVRPTVARTSDGVGVGSPLALAVRGLGPAVDEPGLARDPRLWIGAGLPGARLVLAGDRIVAVVVTARPTPPATAAVDVVAPCVRPSLPDGLGLPGAARGACLDGADALATIGDAVVALATADGKVRKVASIELPGLRWVAPIDAGGKDELVAVLERRDDATRTVSVVALTLEGGRLVRVGEIDAYRLSETNAAWIGARLADLELRLEIQRTAEMLTIGGVLVHGRDAVVDVAPLVPVTLRLHRRTGDDRDRAKVDAGVGDAGPDGPTGPTD
ncbi:MAG: hypothetical protein KBG48_28540 [Kofleriaceae bacterium]|nr:hypothetical protein [Kofleriaceae bacterium]MBP9171380.1 hypothetical protein [Kofleriaceae bacterium]MBP9860612.1 hypothetical protein [Kofleriaceae bacterium]